MRALDRAFQLYEKKLAYFQQDMSQQKVFQEECLKTSLGSILWPRQYWREYSSPFHITIFGSRTIFPLIDLEHRLDWAAFHLRESQKYRQEKGRLELPVFTCLLLTLFQTTVLQLFLHTKQGVISEWRKSGVRTKKLSLSQRRKIQHLIQVIEKMKKQIKSESNISDVFANPDSQLFLDALNEVYHLDLFLKKNLSKINSTNELVLENQRLSLDLRVTKKHREEWANRYQKLKREIQELREKSLYIDEELLKATEGLLGKEVLSNFQEKQSIVSDDSYDRLVTDYQILLEKLQILETENNEMRKEQIGSEKVKVNTIDFQDGVFVNLTDIRERVNTKIYDPNMNNHQLIETMQTELENLVEFRKMVSALHYNLGVLYSRVGSLAKSEIQMRAAREFQLRS